MRERDWREVLYLPLQPLPLSVRIRNLLQKADLKYIGELVQRTETDMLKIQYCGPKSLNEMKEVLTDLHLSFGMKLDNFPQRAELDRMSEERGQVAIMFARPSPGAWLIGARLQKVRTWRNKIINKATPP